MAAIPCLLLALALILGAATSSRSQVLQSGTRYLIALPDTVRNLPLRVPGGSAEPAFEELAWLIVYADRATRIAVRSEGFSLDTVVAPDRSTIVRIPAAARRFATISLAPQKDAIGVTAERPISMYAYFATAFGAEAFTPLPVELWGTEYTVPGLPSETVVDDLTFRSGEEGEYRPIYAPAEFIVIASEDETEVTIEATANLGDWASQKKKITVTLDAGETYLVQPGAPPAPDPRPGQPKLAFGVSDLARTSVTSTRPVGILAANTRTQGSPWTTGFVWTGNSIRNIAAEWLAPRRMNGTRFAYASPWSESRGAAQDIVRVYGTSKSRGGIRSSFPTPLRQIGFNEMHQYSLADIFGNDGSFWIHTTEKAQASVAGTTATIMSDEIASTGIRSWSAATVDLVPRERWGDFTRFHVPGYPVALTHAIALVADPDAEVLLNGVVIDGWKPFFDAAYKWVRLPIDSGDYALTSTGGRFSGVVAGRMSGYEAYRPLGARDRDDGGGLMHASVYHERISIAYAYPLLSGFIAPDSVEIESASDCSGMSIGVTLAYAAGGTATDEIIIGDSTNVRVTITPRRVGTTVTGWDVRIAPRDPARAARALVRVYSPFGTSTSLPYRYVPAQPVPAPAEYEIYDAYIDVARPFTLRLGNAGDSALVLRSARLAGGASGFSIVGRSGDTALAKGEIVFDMSFTGTSYATRYYDTLLLEGPCWSARIPIAARTRAFVPEPLPEITPIDWRDRWLSTLDDCTKSGITGYDSTIRIANRGTRAFVVVSLRLLGADASYFELDSSDAAHGAARSLRYGDIVYPDSIRLQAVRFRPADERRYRCEVELVTQDRDTVIGELVGGGIESHVVVDPEPLDFGGALFRGSGDTIATGSAFVRAMPTRALTVTEISIDGVAPGVIAIDARGGFVAPRTDDATTWWRLEPGEARRVPLLFAPADSGVISGRLVVTGDHSSCDDSTIAITGRTWRALGRIEPPEILASSACERARGEAVIVNTGPVALLVVGARVEPQGGALSVGTAGLPRHIAPGERLALPIDFAPTDSGMTTALLYVDVRDSSGELAIELEPALLQGHATATSMRLGIDRDVRLLPGEKTRLAIELFEPPAGRAVARLGIDVTIDPRVFRVLDVGVGQRTDGWRLDVLERSDARLRVELTAPAGVSLGGSGSVLEMLVEGILSATMQSDVPFVAIAIGEPCVGASMLPGRIAIDSICGLTSRWMEAFGASYRLDPVRLSADGTATIAFELALPSSTTVDILDARGALVTRLVDAHMAAGPNSVRWMTGAEPAGMYVVRVRADGWQSSRSVLITH